ncbi:MAG: hypothetical protein M5U19_00570 [Microthrixaceae bacterium]|nr:hypothetical protein [Microthrixaceae bacterium]
MTARLATVVDLPSEASAEVTWIVDIGLCIDSNLTAVRSDRYASAAGPPDWNQPIARRVAVALLFGVFGDRSDDCYAWRCVLDVGSGLDGVIEAFEHECSSDTHEETQEPSEERVAQRSRAHRARQDLSRLHQPRRRPAHCVDHYLVETLIEQGLLRNEGVAPRHESLQVEAADRSDLRVQLIDLGL